MQRNGLTRRALLKSAAVGAVLATAGGQQAQASLDKKPNILFIVADDLGYADLSSYGHRSIRTPHIDSIAQKGVRFLQAYANSAVCSATRTALITGRYQYRLPLGLEEPLAGRDVGLPPEHPTLPSLLKKVGYKTTLIGKWHLGAFPKYWPLKSGYDHFFGFTGGALDYYSHEAGGPDLWEDDVEVERAGYLTDLLGDQAVKTIKEYKNCESPFFVSLHFNAPHWPWEVPGEEGKKESARLKANRLGLASFDAGTQETYREIVERMDYQVGQVLQALQDNNLAENTIVIFTSDNGGERFSDTWPFSGKKSELLEGGIRIPSIISWPSRIAGGRTSNQVSLSMDWLPTLLEAAGGITDPSYPPDGISLLPGLVNAGAVPIERSVFWRYKGNKQRAARIGDYKYLKILDNTYLFNVVDDPLERANLQSRYPDKFKSLFDQWIAWNRGMLPEIDASGTYGFSARQLADHIGTGNPTTKADNLD